MDIKILGTGCANCKNLEKAALEAVKTMQIDATVSKVEDIQQIIKYGVMRTPALVVDEKVVSVGKVLSAHQIVQLLQN